MTKEEKVLWDRWKQSESQDRPELAELLRRDPDKPVHGEFVNPRINASALAVL